MLPTTGIIGNDRLRIRGPLIVVGHVQFRREPKDHR